MSDSLYTTNTANTFSLSTTATTSSSSTSWTSFSRYYSTNFVDYIANYTQLSAHIYYILLSLYLCSCLIYIISKATHHFFDETLDLSFVYNSLPKTLHHLSSTAVSSLTLYFHLLFFVIIAHKISKRQ